MSKPSALARKIDRQVRRIVAEQTRARIALGHLIGGIHGNRPCIRIVFQAIAETVLLGGDFRNIPEVRRHIFAGLKFGIKFQDVLEHGIERHGEISPSFNISPTLAVMMLLAPAVPSGNT